jgi:hypothetical protein
MQIAHPAHPSQFASVGAFAGLVIVLTIIGASIAPIATFVLMISAFGLPHVIYELRYCDTRFSSRTPPGLLIVLGGLVSAIAIGRIANGAHWLTSDYFVPLELGLGSVLALVAVALPCTRLVLYAAACLRAVHGLHAGKERRHRRAHERRAVALARHAAHLSARVSERAEAVANKGGRAGGHAP